MTTVGVVTGAGRGMGAACAARIVEMVDVVLLVDRVWAKRGVLRLVEREAVRLGRLGGRICSVSPGIIDTPMGRPESAAREASDLLVGLTPLGREGRPEEVAAAVAFLLSDEASFVNGIDLPVEGGVLAAFRSAPGGVPLS